MLQLNSRRISDLKTASLNKSTFKPSTMEINQVPGLYIYTLMSKKLKQYPSLSTCSGLTYHTNMREMHSSQLFCLQYGKASLQL